MDKTRTITYTAVINVPHDASDETIKQALDFRATLGFVLVDSIVKMYDDPQVGLREQTTDSSVTDWRK